MKGIFYTNWIPAIGAGLMIAATIHTFSLPDNFPLIFAISFGAFALYNFHWAFTNSTSAFSDREKWSANNKKLLFVLGSIGVAGALFFALQFSLSTWSYIFPLALMAFVYTAPKLPYPIFKNLSKFLFEKSLYLTIAWLYGTVLLPIFLSHQVISAVLWDYIWYRFAIILIVCFLFDYRDRVQDRFAGIKSMLLAFGGGVVQFGIIVLLSYATLKNINMYGHISNSAFLIQFLPIVLLIVFFRKIMQSKKDLWYEGLLDCISIIGKCW
jgi:hypothetical protein